MSKRFQKAMLVVSALAVMLMPELAFAQIDTVGQAADHVVTSGSFQGMWDIISASAYVMGAFIGVRAALQLKDHTNAPSQTTFSKPLTSLLLSAMLMSFPTFIVMLQDSLGFANGASVFNATSAGSGPAQSGNMDLGQMFVALSSSIPGMMKIATYVAATAGAFFMLRALFMLPQLEQGRESLSKVVWMAIAGVGLWSIMPMINVAMTTVGMSATDPASILTAKYSSGGGGGFEGTIASVQAFVQFLGLIAFIRGMMILKAIGENKEGVMNRALTHIVGGSLAMNIGWTVHLLAYSVGATTSICGLAATMCS